MTKILIGGVPYGTDNVGDEAILAGIVTSLRRLRNDLEISVITSKPVETAEKLKVGGVMLSWDKKTGQPLWDRKVVSAHRDIDIYIHGGATGLHDYPMYLCAGLRISQEFGNKTVICGTGGGPYRFRFFEGGKAKALNLAGKLTLGLINFRRIAENTITSIHRAEIVRRLKKTDLLLIRDEDTRQTLAGYGLPSDIIHVVGDAAIELEPAQGEGAEKIVRDNGLDKVNRPLVAVCISSQRIVKDIDAVARVCDYIVEKYGADIVFFSMNPFTDTEVGERLRGAMSRKQNAHVVKEVYYEPEEVMAFLPRLSMIISSRLHLIILGAVMGVTSVGIGRGSAKVKSFLGKFGLEPAGEFDTVNFEALKNRFDDIWSRREEIRPVLLEEIGKDKERFRGIFGKIADLF